MKKPPMKAAAVVIVLGIAALVAKFMIFKDTFLYVGTLEATKVDLSARLAAAIQQIDVQEGDRVKQDQVLVKLTCEDIKIAARLAHENFERYLKLSTTGSATQEMMDQMRSRKEDADTRLNWCVVSSPIEGKVLSRYHEPGEWMSPGMKILTIANIRDIWAYIYVPQPLVARLSPGMKLQGILPELNSRKFEGVILKINDEAEFTPKNVQTRTERERLVFGVKVSFKDSNAEEILKPGMSIEVELPK